MEDSDRDRNRKIDGKNRQREILRSRNIASHSLRNRRRDKVAQGPFWAERAGEWLEWVGEHGVGRWELGLTLGLSAGAEGEGCCAEDDPQLPRQPGGDRGGRELGLRAVPGA